MKSHVLHKVWCYISGAAAGAFCNWPFLGVNGLQVYLGMIFYFVFQQRVSTALIDVSRTSVMTSLGLSIDEPQRKGSWSFYTAEEPVHTDPDLLETHFTSFPLPSFSLFIEVLYSTFGHWKQRLSKAVVQSRNRASSKHWHHAFAFRLIFDFLSHFSLNQWHDELHATLKHPPPPQGGTPIWKGQGCSSYRLGVKISRSPFTVLNIRQ